ncbi:hypothetical protein AVI51_07035 [Piscirickettsia salmonis]|uniref:Uncharacterized protein n=1 Tax=Piscirickettsia salmonis TaxID=1238 RepID=A0A9Q5VK39_PISSA|nr:hypothetical protein [Piscirickettsia salmonis]ALA25827.1 rod shape-determining protein MreC [Piscirickettsia salmonis]APS43304.1 hypothetical protein AVI48_02230 [Piscirickettsia salmonis]APS46654.1 hypothetical protein AVI49_02835 [Piscirickettsia salmonis]APS50632.1 hypothetical protein AVI50_07120 [Piscirickettsia salmonis]APS53834.1 hypothetical protein AVI51_07035 [Piscirickettsia salmonis]
MPTLSSLQGGLELKRRLIELAREHGEVLREQLLNKSETLEDLSKVIATDYDNSPDRMDEITAVLNQELSHAKYQDIVAELKPAGASEITRKDFEACALGLAPGAEVDPRLQSRFEYQPHEGVAPSPKPRKVRENNHNSLRQLQDEAEFLLESGEPVGSQRWKQLEAKFNKVAERINAETPAKFAGLKNGILGTIFSIRDFFRKREAKAEYGDDVDDLNELGRLLKNLSKANVQHQISHAANAAAAEYQMFTPCAQQAAQPGAQAELHISTERAIPGM